MSIWGKFKGKILESEDNSLHEDLGAKFCLCIAEACELEQKNKIKISAEAILEKNPELREMSDIEHYMTAFALQGRNAEMMKALEVWGILNPR